jgi:hypothetical protein
MGVRERGLNSHRYDKLILLPCSLISPHLIVERILLLAAAAAARHETLSLLMKNK